MLGGGHKKELESFVIRAPLFYGDDDNSNSARLSDDDSSDSVTDRLYKFQFHDMLVTIQSSFFSSLRHIFLSFEILFLSSAWF